MQENNIIKLIKKTFSDKNLASVFLTSLLSFVVIFLITLGIIWHFRGDVFGYFAKQYVAKSQGGEEKVTEKILEKQTIFSQESFVVDAVKSTNPDVVSIIISKEVPKYE